MSGMGDLAVGSFKLSSVLVLLRMSLPFAVIRRIPAIIVDAAKRKSSGFFAHISEKVFEAIEPAVTNLDASTSVILESFDIRIGTTGFHVNPCPECPRPSPVGGVSVFKVQPTGQFPLEASAGLRVSAQTGAANGQFAPASATTLPVDQSTTAMREVEDGQASIGLASPVDEVGHITII